MPPRARRPRPGRSRRRGPSPPSAPGMPPALPSAAGPSMPSSPPQEPRREAPARRADPSGAAPPASRARQSASRMLIETSSHHRPSRRIASRGAALGHESAWRVGADRPLVELEDRQGDPVQPERPERVVDHQPGRLGPVAVAPGIRLADRDVVQGRPVVAVELAEGAGADQAVRCPGRGWPWPANRARSPGRGRTGRSRRPASGLPGIARGGRSRDPRTSAGRPPGSPGTWRRRTTQRPSIESGNHVRSATRARYTIARMRRWSELAERVAATTRTSEKTALLAAYLRDPWTLPSFRSPSSS